MPTFEGTRRFWRDYYALTRAQQERFTDRVESEFVPDLTNIEEGKAVQFRAGLRVSELAGDDYKGIFEMTWAPDGRATFQFGEPKLEGKRHVIWRRVGTHAIFRRG